MSRLKDFINVKNSPITCRFQKCSIWKNQKPPGQKTGFRDMGQKMCMHRLCQNGIAFTLFNELNGVAICHI